MKHEPSVRDETVALKTYITRKSSQTLVEFLANRFKYHSPEEWEALIAQKRVTVNDHEASPGQPLRAGDEVTYYAKSWEEPEVATDYRIVFEDQDLLVISKPAPLPVHAIGAYFKNTLMYLLRRDLPGAENYTLVHRLDAETSGLLLLVKDRSLVKPFQKLWESGVRKTYRALVFGEFPEGDTQCEGPIGPKKGLIRMKQAVVPDGKPAATIFRLLERKGKFSRVEAELLTGRTHQVRTHLEHLGFPLVGDKLYSGDDETFLHFYENGWDDWLKERVLLPRAALHAYRLEFTHVRTGEKLVLEDAMPKDLQEFWDPL